MNATNDDERNKGGRPPKFSEPRRPITVTLPERTLEQLAAIDKDRARAIVKATEGISPRGKAPDRPVEVVEALPGTGIILVGPSRYLKKIPFLRLVEVAPSRFLLVIPTGTAPDSLEIALVDLRDSIPTAEVHERKMITALQLLLRTFRLNRKVTKAEILFVSTGK